MRRLLLLIFLLPVPFLLPAQTFCRTAAYRQQALEHDPSLAVKLASVEAFTQNYVAGQGKTTYGMDSNSIQSGIIVIPVVVHVLYNSSQQNISDAQVRTQIAVLNQDYRRLNADTINTPDMFKGVAADFGIQFQLASVDTNGHATTGIIHKHTSVQQFGIDDAIKFSWQGGDDGWNKDEYLNIWVGSLTGGILGYSSLVGGPQPTDGVVVLYTAFGTMGAATAPYDQGRTATHEIGHWLNLIHTWGDAYCGNDYVADTPPQQEADYGCPTGIIITCNNAPTGNMYQNYMDFTNDVCMNLFTNGQKSRMMALFQPGGERYAILSSTAVTATPLPEPDTATAEYGNVMDIYPNPSTGVVTVRLWENVSMGSYLEIYNQVGQKVLTTLVTQSTIQLDLSSLGKGLYYFKLYDQQNKATAKLLKL